ncbi:MAG TPA: Rieske 2Fe-2S domain-containing protein [Anaerolineales bacterium]|nr:Rieske 2Fe-2S domain-containing protein [Anaerolineales bacterium]
MIDETKYEIVEVELEHPESKERIFLEIDDLAIVVFNIAGKYFAIGDVCSHDNGPLGDGLLEGYHVVCPRHGAEFDIRNGKAMKMPAVEDIPSYPVYREKDSLFIGIPK